MVKKGWLVIFSSNNHGNNNQILILRNITMQRNCETGMAQPMRMSGDNTDREIRLQ